MSRSLGDSEYKRGQQEAFWECEFSGDLVISEPEIRIYEICTIPSHLISLG